MSKPKVALLFLALVAGPSLGDTEKSPSPPLVTNLGSPEEEKIPKDIFLTLGTALMASMALSSCGLTSFNTTKVPLLVLTGASAVYLFREVAIKEDFTEKSKLLFQVEQWKETEKARRQQEAFERAAQEQRLAAEASDKKASNAKFLERSLYLSSALFLAFPLVACAKCTIGYLACLPTHNACKETACGVALSPSSSPTRTFLRSLFTLERAYAFNAKKLGIVSLGLLLGHAKALGQKMAAIPDVGKSALLALLAKRANGSKKQWEKAAQTYRENAKKYESLGKSIEVALRAGGGHGGPERTDVITPKYTPLPLAPMGTVNKRASPPLLRPVPRALWERW